MFGCEALKSATTLSSTVFCSGASPPPRQQYQRSSTTPPGAADAVSGAVDAGAADSLATAAGDELAGPDGPQAAETKADAAVSEPALRRPVRLGLLLNIPT